jgi:hypothetical protein
MKSIVRLFTILAFANLLAIGGFIGWLAASGRLDEERIARVRATFAPTIVEEKRLAEEGATKADEAVRLAAEERRLLELPLSRSEQIVTMERFEQRAALAVRALEEERRRMLADLSARESAVTAREQALDTRMKEWEASIADAKERTTDEQFRKAVRLLEAMPPKQGKEWIIELMNTDRAPMAVAYLDAMNPAKSAALLKAFKDDTESKMATDLLERLRLLGLESETAPERTNGANPAQSPAESADPGRASRADAGGPSANGPLGVP